MHKRLFLIALLSAGLGGSGAAQCPPKTVVSDTIVNADGTPASGRVVIAWPTFQAGACQVISGQVTVNVAAGSFSVELYANDAAVPEGTSYRVTYYLKSGRVTTEYWVVPSSATPVSLATVRSPTVPVPNVMFSQAQVTNLVSDLIRKVELPSACPAGKFLQTNGATAPPQVACVDGTGAPLASVAVSGTVKTDITEGDPIVYTKASADSLLAGKANSVHGHAAADLTSGTLDPARLPNPAATTLGGVKSGACSGTDKVTGISTAGAITCATDQSGGGGSTSQHQANGTNLAANDPVNFQDSATIAITNPSAGNVTALVKDGSITAAKLSVANPTNAQLSGVGDSNIAAGALSPDRIVGTATTLSDRFGSAPGSKIATTSLSGDPAANNCVKWAAGGKLDDAGAACGSGGSDSTKTHYIEMTCDTPRTQNLAGNSFWTVAALTEWDFGHWEFVKDVDGKIYCHAIIPNTLAVTPAGAVVLDVTANATSGITRLSVRSFAAGDGETLNPSSASWTAAAAQDVTVPGTARNLKRVTFTTLPALAAAKVLVVEVFHQGTHTNDTLAVNTELFRVYLRVDLTQ